MRERTARRQRAQGLQNAAAHLPVGAVEPLPRPCAFLSEPGHAGLHELALRLQRALFALRRLRRAHERAELHHRLVPQHGLLRRLRQHYPCERALERCARAAQGFHAKERAAQRAANIRIDHGDTLAVCEAEHRAGRVIAHAGQGHQLVVLTRQAVVVVACHHFRALLQSQCATRVPETSPCADHLGFLCCRKRRRAIGSSMPPNTARRGSSASAGSSPRRRARPMALCVRTARASHVPRSATRWRVHAMPAGRCVRVRGHAARPRSARAWPARVCGTLCGGRHLPCRKP